MTGRTSAVFVLWGESDQRRADRLQAEGLRFRKNGALDMRHSSSRFMAAFWNGRRTLDGLIHPA